MATTTAKYDAFISYSRGADGRTAAQLQRALHRIATPWYRLRGMRVFRDETDLTVSPEGWPAIQRALDQSRFLVLLASTRAAQAPWVGKEVEHWLQGHPPDTVMIAITDGDIAWDSAANDFDWQRTTSVPKALSRRFRGEPFWVDLRWTDENQVLTLRQLPFLQAVARLAAPIRQLDVEALVSEDRRQHRRNLRFAFGATLVLMAALAVSGWLFQARRIAVERERDQRVLAGVAQAYRVLYASPLQAIDEVRDAWTIRSNAQTAEALQTALDVARQRLVSLGHEREVTGTGAGYLMERWRKGEVFTRLRADGRFALVASERGKEGNVPPGNAFLIRLDNLRTLELQPGIQATNRRLEHLGFSFAGDEVFVARQFYLDIFDLEGRRTASVQLEHHAKPTHLIAGRFGSFVLVGDTVGNLMLADTASGVRPQFRGGRHPDSVVFVESNAARDRAVVVFESGRTDFLLLQDLVRVAQKPETFQHRVAETGTVHVAFAPEPRADRFVLSTRSGGVEVWDSSTGVPVRAAAFRHEGSGVGMAGFSRDSLRVISLGEDGTCHVWDLARRERIASYPSE